MKKFRQIFGGLLALCVLLSGVSTKIYAADTEHGSEMPAIFDDKGAWSNAETSSFWDSAAGAWGAVAESSTVIVLNGDDSSDAADSTEAVGLEALTIGDTDAFETPEGDGWYFDAETGVLTLSGANITGTGDCGISAVGDLTIELDGNTTNTITGDLTGIYVQGNLVIQNGSLQVQSTAEASTGIWATGDVFITSCDTIRVSAGLVGIALDSGCLSIYSSNVEAESVLDSLSAQEIDSTYFPYGVKSSGEIKIQENSSVTVSSSYIGVFGGESISICDSTVDVKVDYCGMVSTLMDISSSEVTVSADITMERLYSNHNNNSSLPLLTVGLYGSGINIADSHIEAEATITAVCADNNDSYVNITNSVMKTVSGYGGIWAVQSVKVMDSEIDTDITLPIEDALAYAKTYNVSAPPSGVYVLHSSSELNIENADISISSPCDGTGADFTHIKNSTIDVRGGGYGILAGAQLTIDGCERISVQNDRSEIEAFLNAGGNAYITFCSAGAQGDVSITDCSDLTVLGSWMGLLSANGKLSIKNSTASISGGLYGLGGLSTDIDYCDILAEATWDEDELKKWNWSVACAVAGIDALDITNAKEIVGGEIGACDLNGSNGYAVLDENGIPATKVTIYAMDDSGGDIDDPEPAEIAEGTCGDNLTWTLTENGVLTISGEEAAADSASYSVSSRTASPYDMYDFASAEETPWYDYRSQICSVVVGHTVTSIGSNAFNGCVNLTEVSVGTGVTRVGEKAFSHCENVAVSFKGDAPEISEDAFEASDATVSYPADNETWDEVKENDYGGTITWVAREEQSDQPASGETTFTDINETDYFYEPVLWAYENGITSGTDDTHFSPSAACTRAQAVVFLWRAMGEPEPESMENPFTDVKASEYYYKAVLWAYENGIASGMSATTFRPDTAVTRGQAVTFLWRAEGKPEATNENPFTDVKSGEYYYDAVLWAYENGITSGATATLFKPAAACTRGQVVTFLYRDMGE